MKELSLEELAKLLKEGLRPGQIVVDVREPMERRAKLIEGTVLIPITQLEERVGELQNYEEIIVHCSEGTRCRLACEMLEDRGFKHLAHVQGSIRNWEKAGLPVLTGRGVKFSLPQQTYMVVGSILLVTGLCTVFITKWIVLVPTTMGCLMFINGYRGTCWMEMWLGKMPWNQKIDC